MFAHCCRYFCSVKQITTAKAMTIISPTDIIQARAIGGGATVAGFRSRGFSSTAEVVAALRTAAGHLRGSVELMVFNATRGWTERRVLFLA